MNYFSLKFGCMKKIFSLYFIISFFAFCDTFGQSDEIKKLIDEGIALHDKGDFEAALLNYDKALIIDKNNIIAIAEKSLSLLSLKRYDAVIANSKYALNNFKADKTLKNIYITYANAYDQLKEYNKAIDVYNDGIKAFPDFYLLQFNKGVSLTSLEKNTEAIECFKKSAILNPNHASSHYALGNMLYHLDDNKIPVILVLSKFLILEPQSERANTCIKIINTLMNENIKQKDDNTISISIPSKIVDEKKNTPDNFRSVELILSMSAALDYDDQNKNKSELENFIRKFETMCASLKETKEKKIGFYWEYYVPYFIEMYTKKHIETFSNITFATIDDPKVESWLKNNLSNIENFYKWSDDYIWKK
jgi:tetratricopeptide (TPR) repeat protein